MHDAPVRLIHLVAVQHLQRDLLFAHAPALAFHFFALARVETGEKIVEVPVALVVPVVLTPHATQHAALFQQICIAFVSKQEVRTGQFFALAVVHDAVVQEAADGREVLVRRDQQTMTSGRL